VPKKIRRNNPGFSPLRTETRRHRPSLALPRVTTGQERNHHAAPNGGESYGHHQAHQKMRQSDVRLCSRRWLQVLQRPLRGCRRCHRAPLPLRPFLLQRGHNHRPLKYRSPDPAPHRDPHPAHVRRACARPNGPFSPGIRGTVLPRPALFRPVLPRRAPPRCAAPFAPHFPTCRAFLMPPIASSPPPEAIPPSAIRAHADRRRSSPPATPRFDARQPNAGIWAAKNQFRHHA
jgi:hypothetical protein